jgi:hypothetical protein
LFRHFDLSSNKKKYIIKWGLKTRVLQSASKFSSLVVGKCVLGESTLCSSHYLGGGTYGLMERNMGGLARETYNGGKGFLRESPSFANYLRI